MATSGEARPQTASSKMYQVPMTIEGASVLHQMLHFRWAEWRKRAKAEKQNMVQEAQSVLGALERSNSALYSVLGHKADLLLVHFRNGFDELKQVELALSNLALWDYVEPANSYLSVVELGLYESSVKLYRSLGERGLEPRSEEWNREVEEAMERQREAMRPRLWPQIPEARYLCFYPMDRRRGEQKNWYMLPIEERQQQMAEHGTVGHRYAGKVRQVITGSMGFDDWEWGVDLWSDDPLQFKKIIYEMRFDEVSAMYAQFGAFVVGVRVPAVKLGELLAGTLPSN